jgi:hypothetical protein
LAGYGPNAAIKANIAPAQKNGMKSKMFREICRKRHKLKAHQMPFAFISKVSMLLYRFVCFAALDRSSGSLPVTCHSHRFAMEVLTAVRD